MSEPTDGAEYINLGKQVRRDAGEFLVRCFAGDLIDSGYPLSKEMTATTFRDLSDEHLGRRMADWMREEGR